MSGWEGSAADSRFFENARLRDFLIGPGKYYLADAGFASCNALLTPYRQVQYHMKEWGQSNLQYDFYFSISLISHFVLILTGHKMPKSFSICIMHLQEMQ